MNFLETKVEGFLAASPENLASGGDRAGSPPVDCADA